MKLRQALIDAPLKAIAAAELIAEMLKLKERVFAEIHFSWQK